jgi:hypothetical protein
MTQTLKPFSPARCPIGSFPSESDGKRQKAQAKQKQKQDRMGRIGRIKAKAWIA